MNEIDRLLRNKAGIELPNIVITRPADSSIKNDSLGKVVRGGTPGKESNIEIRRSGESPELKSYPEIYKPSRGNTEKSFEDPDPYTHAIDTNNNTLKRTSVVKETSEIIGNIDSEFKNAQGWAEKFGVKIPDATSLNNWIKQITGGKGIELISNTDLGNEGLIGYLIHLWTSNVNLARIPADLLLRMYLKSQQEKLSGTRKFDELSDELLDRLSNKSQSSDLKVVSNRPVNTNLKADLYEYNQFGEDNGTELETSGALVPHPKSADKSILSGFGNLSDVWKSSTGDIKILKDDDQIYFQTYNKLRDFEFSDNFYWGVKLTKFESEAAFGKSLLPDFPADYQSGWWPVTACSFTKGSLTSKSFQLPFFKLEIPHQGGRPSNLKLTMVDDSKHSIRYWLDNYIRKTFDLENNLVLPYKNICWDIIVCRYDCTLHTLYQKDLICLLSQFNSPFLGVGHHGSDDIDLSFEIVGEYKMNDKVAEY